MAAFAAALVLVHAPGHQTLRGRAPDPDTGVPTMTTQVRVECAAPAVGPRLTDQGYGVNPGEVKDAPGISEDDTKALEQEGIAPADPCHRVRTERLAHAGELGVLGLLLAGAAARLGRDRRRTEALADSP